MKGQRIEEPVSKLKDSYRTTLSDIYTHMMNFIVSQGIVNEEYNVGIRLMP